MSYIYETDDGVIVTRATEAGQPPPEVIDAMESGVVEVVRSLEIYEKDGVTLWTGNKGAKRLIGGSVTATAGADERRVLDLTLDNEDGALRPNPNNGFWYDKVIKPFWGVKYQGKDVQPRVAVIEAPNEYFRREALRNLASMGFPKVDYLPDASSLADLDKYGIIVSSTSSQATQDSALLTSLWNAGKHVITIGSGSTETELPHYTVTRPDAGVELNSNPSIDSDASGYVTGTVTPTRTSGGKLAVPTSTGSTSNDTFAVMGAGEYRMTLGMKAGFTYELKSKLTVPADASGGEFGARSRSMVVFYNDGTGQGYKSFASNKAALGTTTDLVLQFTLPPGTVEAWVRLYNGYNNAGTNPVVEYDDISLKEYIVWAVSPAGGDNPAAGSFVTGDYYRDTGRRPIALAQGVRPLSVVNADSPAVFYTGAMIASAKGGYWIDLHHPIIGAEGKKMLRAAINYARGYHSVLQWETQLGEYVIDVITEDNFPKHTKVTGRDYTKRMLNSKLRQTTTFGAGTDLRTFMVAIAAGSGIPANKISVTIEGGEKMSSEMSFERGADHWSLVKEAADAYGYDVFFDLFGTFTVKKLPDPYQENPVWTFKTGYEEGDDAKYEPNLVSTSRSNSDTNIFNVVGVFGDPADGEERISYYGEASNTDPASPTSIARIGERVAPPLITTWLGSNKECQDTAAARLKISALESYTMSFSSVYYPWLEVNTTVAILDPERLSFEPTKYLMDSLTFPLELGPMSGTGKRVTYVGHPG